MSFSRRHGLSLIPFALATSAWVVLTPFAGSAATPSTASILKTALSSLDAESGVHITVASKVGSTVSSVVADLGATSGREVMASGAANVTIIVTPTNAYLSGSATGLTTLMELTAAEQKKIGTRAVVMKKGTTPYSDFEADLTTTVFSSLLPAAKGTALSTVVVGGVKEYELSWKTKASSSEPATKSSLYLSEGAKVLPISETITSSTGGGTTHFSRWGEDVTEAAPASSNTVTYASVFG